MWVQLCPCPAVQNPARASLCSCAPVCPLQIQLFNQVFLPFPGSRAALPGLTVLCIEPGLCLELCPLPRCAFPSHTLTLKAKFLGTQSLNLGEQGTRKPLGQLMQFGK